MSYRKLTHACARHQRRPAGKLSTKEKAVMRRANTIVRKRFRRLAVLESPGAANRFLTLQLGLRQSEVFCAIWLDTRHRVLKFEELFQGTIDGAVVHPREVVRRALMHNAAAVIFAHSHPSGNPEPSPADIKLTHRLREALDLVDIRTLDHIVVGGTETVSLSRRGLL